MLKKHGVMAFSIEFFGCQDILFFFFRCPTETDEPFSKLIMEISVYDVLLISLWGWMEIVGE